MGRTWFLSFSTVALLTISGISLANSEGEVLYKACIACHGEQGQGNESLCAPSLAGQPAWYLARQLDHFKQGVRGSDTGDIFGMQMKMFAAQLANEQQVQAISDYISQLPTPSIENDLKGDMMNGSRYYQAKCGACHGGKAEGNEAFNAPKLANQQVSYLQRQMQYFQQGVRGSHESDKLGRQMAMMAKVVSDEELQDILYYISQQ